MSNLPSTTPVVNNIPPPAAPAIRFSVWPAAYETAERWRCRANGAETVYQCAWPEFAAWLAAPLPVHDKDAQAYSPLSAIKPGKGGRVNGGAAAFLVAEYDDTATPELLRRAQDTLKDYDAIVHTSASATAECPRFRIVLRTSRPIETSEEYRSCVRGLGRLLGVEPEDSQRTRLWYRPVHGCAVRVFAGGQAWDVGRSVQLYPTPPKVARMAPSTATLSAVELEHRRALAWRALDLQRPDKGYRAACVMHDYGIPAESAIELLRMYGTAVGWSDDRIGNIPSRVQHSYEYAADPFGWALEDLLGRPVSL